MDAAALAAKTRYLRAKTVATGAVSTELRAIARYQRRETRALVLRSSYRRIARLAQGGSDAHTDFPKWPGDGLKETRERVCPSCGDRAIKPQGHALALDGVLKSLCFCKGCERLFVFLRSPRS